MGFAEGLMQGLQLVQGIYREKEDRAWRSEQRQFQRDEQKRLGAADARAADLQQLQIDQARRNSERDQALAAAEKEVQSAGRVSVATSFQPGKKEGEVEQVFAVGDQTFNNRAQAEAAAASMNTPLSIARRQYAKAQEIGIPALLKQYGDLYANARSTTEAEFKQAFGEAMRQGGVDGVVSLYNQQVKDGRTMVAQRQPDGKLVIGTYVGGKLQGAPMTYPDEKAFIAEQVARFQASPDAYLDYFQRGRAFDEGRRQFDTQMGLQERQLAEAARGNTLAHQRGMAGVGVQREALNKPTVIPVLTDGADGGTNVGAAVVDTRGRTPTITSLTGTSQAGVRRTPKQVDPVAAAIAARMGAGNKATPAQTGGFSIDEAGLQRLDELMNGGR